MSTNKCLVSGSFSFVTVKTHDQYVHNNIFSTPNMCIITFSPPQYVRNNIFSTPNMCAITLSPQHHHPPYFSAHGHSFVTHTNLLTMLSRQVVTNNHICIPPAINTLVFRLLDIADLTSFLSGRALKSHVIGVMQLKTE
jgi:hypothetical protein